MKICVVITDCDDDTIEKIRNCKLTNVFSKPKPGQRNEMSRCVGDIKKWLAANASINNGYDVCWWKKIKYNGLMMPFECVRMFNGKLNYQTYVKQRCFLHKFEQLLGKEFDKSQVSDSISNKFVCEKEIDELYKYKQTNFNFGKKWQDYSNNINKDSEKERNELICEAADSKVSRLLQIFIQFCIFNYESGIGHSTYNGNEYNTWLNSEYLFILNDQCNAYNQRIEALEKYVQSAKMNDQQLETHEMLDKLAECEITSYDFVSNCDILFKFAQLYQQRFGAYLSGNAPNIIQQNLKLLIKRYRLFCKRLFEQGTPVTFTDSLNNDVNDEFVYHVFGGLSNNKNSSKRSTSNVISVAIAGPQSSGKSTLLRRLFGIDARVKCW